MRAHLGLLTLALGACTGVIADPSTSGSSAGDEPGASPRRGSASSGDSPEAACDLRVAPEPFRRLTRDQYDNSIFDLLGDDIAPATASFPPDDDTDGFEVGLTVSPLLAEKYFEAAELIATRATSDLDALLACDVATAGEDGCAEAFVASFVRRAYRRAVTATERDRFAELFSAVRDAEGFRAGIEAIVAVTLSSPHFLYHREPVPAGAAPGDVIPVTGYAMASRLGYLLWRSAPDDALLDAAEAGELETAAEVEAQARRMLDDPRAHRAIDTFAEQWLDLSAIDRLEKDPSVVEGFDAELAAELRASVSEHVASTVWDGDGSVRALLTDAATFNGPRMVELFGADDDRRGLLEQPGLLALLAKPNQSDPIHRGVFVRERLLCQDLPPPPDDVEIRPPDPSPGASTRERFAEHTADERCAGCHQLIDPIGFGFEAYDAIGRFRTTDEGVPVDDSGEIFGTTDADGPFEGVRELSARLAESDQVNECVATQLFRSMVGRRETPLDGCSIEHLFERASAEGWSIPEVLVALTSTDAFLYRVVPERSE